MGWKLGQKIIDIIRFKNCNRIKINNYGSGNIIQITPQQGISLTIFGNNNEIIIKTTDRFIATIDIGTIDCPINNCKIFVDENVTSNGLYVRMLEHNESLHIGKNTMISDNVELWVSDTHTVFDDNNNVINYGKSISIGTHCWICRGVKILKNTTIANGSIIGMGTILSGNFQEERVVIAGNPGKIVKRNINWSSLRPNQFEEKAETLVAVKRERESNPSNPKK